MELELIQSRLQNKYLCLRLLTSYYHSIESILLDINTIATNCQLYNEAGSPLVNDVLQLREKLVQSISEIHTPAGSVSFSEDHPSEIQAVIDHLFVQLDQLFKPLQAWLEKPLQPYMITYCDKL